MPKSKTFFLVSAGVASALMAALVALLGFTRLAPVFLAASIATGLVIQLVTHRFIVRSQSLGGSRQQAVAIREAISKLANTNAKLVQSVQQNESKSTALRRNSDASELERAPGGTVGNSLNHSLHPGGVGPAYELAERIVKSPGKIETFALRVKSGQVREGFARAATGMTYGVDDVLRILRTMRAGRLKGNSIVSTWDPKVLLCLARVMANQRTQAGDIEDAELIFNAMRAIHGVKVLGRADAYIYAEVLQLLGNHKLAQKILKDTRVIRRDPIHAELAKANGAAAIDDWTQWLSTINNLLASEGISPIGLNEHSQRSPLDSIKPSEITPRSVDGPMVTVIVPSFEGANHIETTLQCLDSQTWKNLEIIVVDDGSSESNLLKLRAICDSFPGVILIEQGRNLGAYPARNRALENATGQFVTVHDDDDWSHPQKIEIQARHLQNHPDVYANMTRHARVSESLIFTRINNNPSFSQPNFSSLMLRRDLFNAIGVWDEVNRGADAEFRDRLVRATGKKVEVLNEVPLSFTRTHEGSLTSGEIGRGYIDPSRLFYQSAYQAVHREIVESSRGVDSELIKGFARPLNMLPGNRGVHLGTFDVVFATDFAFPGGTSNLTLNEIEVAADAGLRVGLVHMFSPVNAGTINPTERALSIASRNDVEVLSLNDQVIIKHLIVRHPSVLQYAENLTSKFEVEKLTVIINNPPVLHGGSGFVFDFQDVSANCKKIFGITPSLTPESGVTAQLSKAVSRSFEISEELWPGFVKFSDEPITPRDFSSLPTLGRHSRDAALKWPSKLQTYREVYCSNDVFNVSVMGGVDSLSSDARKLLIANANVIPFNGMDVEDYLDSIDFWAYFHADSLTESFGMAAVEAMSRGLVVLLPNYMSVNFGDAAIYCKPSEVKKIVSEFWSNPQRYAEQSERARKFALENFSDKAFLKRLSN